MSVLHFSAESFQKALADNAVVAVDFWATWCGPCKMVAPAVEAVATAMEGKAAVGKIDVDQEGALAQKFGIMSIPTIIVFKNGEEVDRKVGVLSADALEAMIAGQL